MKLSAFIPNIFSLKFRIFGLFFIVISTLQLATLYEVYTASVGDAFDEVREEINDAANLFLQEYDRRNRFFNSAINSLAKDLELQNAAKRRWVKSINNILTNQSHRIGSDIALFVSSNGYVVSTDSEVKIDDDFHVMLEHIGNTPLTRALKLGDSYYQMNLVSIEAPSLLGWLAIGVVIDDQLAMEYAGLTKSDISIVEMEDTPRFVSTSLMEDRKKINAIWLSDVLDSQGIYHLRHQQSESLMLSVPITGVIGKPLAVIVEGSITDKAPEFFAWWNQLYRLLAFNFLQAVIVAFLVARGINKPIIKLLTAADKMTSGDYQTSIDVKGRTEIGLLAKKFTQMQVAVAEREREIRFRASHDSLTGLLNRDGFSDAVSSKIFACEDSGQFVVVIAFSIRRFNEVTDTLGYRLSDQLLDSVSNRLKSQFDEAVDIARFNSDEFAIATAITNFGDIYKISDQIHHCFDQVFYISDIEFAADCVQGISVSPDHADDSVTLIRLATIARYHAMEKASRRIVYDLALDNNSIERLTLMSDLQDAIKSHQLVIYYQPKLSLAADGAHIIENVECLVRWVHAERGLISPDDFIPIAEQTGTIVAVTNWVLESAIQQCCRWQQQGIRLVVAVNISAVDLLSDNFAERMSALLQKYSLSSEYLVLEITESAVMQDPEESVAVLQQLRSKGIRLSIDDYGTGYSSLAQLKKMPVQELKIDKSFVMELDEDDVIIVKSTIEMGHNMGLKVVAEGVESQRQLDQLILFGCDSAQGMGISPPLPAEQFEEWLGNCRYAVSG